MKKKYNKPLINITTVRNEMGFCSSVVQQKPESRVETTGHEIREIDLEDNHAWNQSEWDTN